LGIITLEIGVADNSNKLPIKEWFYQFLDLRYEGLEKYKPPKEVFQLKDFYLGEIKGIKTELGALPPAVGSCKTIFIPKDFKVVSVAFCQHEAWYFWNLNIETKLEKMETSIITTLRFIE
jgi:hypothetical protein